MSFTAIAGPLLSRTEAAEALTDAGYPISVSTLAKFACHSDGPPHTKIGRVVKYDAKELFDWAKQRIQSKRKCDPAA